MIKSKKVLALLSIGLFAFMSTLDGSIVNIALPTISRELGVGMQEVTWTVTVYLVVISGLLLLFGRLGDLMGKTTIFRYGTLIFTVGSLLAGFNFGLSFLIVARIVQAIGAAMTMSNSFGITSMISTPSTRARSMSIIAMFVSLGLISGPAVGGVLLQFLPWSYIFWLNVPIGIIAAAVGHSVLPRETQSTHIKEVDIIGASQLFLLIVVLFLSLNSLQSLGYASTLTWLGLFITVMLFIWFIMTERRVKHPLLALAIFKNKLFNISVISSLLVFTSSACNNILMPFYLQNYRHFTAGFSGLLLMSIPAAMFIFAPISGVLSDKLNKEVITIVGLTGLVISQFGYIFFHSESSFIWLIGTFILNGAAAGLFQSPNNALVMENVTHQYFGIAGSLNALARNMGFVLGTVLATTLLFISMSTQLNRHVTDYVPQHPEVFLNGMHFAFYVSLGLILVAWCLIAYRLWRNSGHIAK